MQEYFLDVVKNHYFDFEGRASISHQSKYRFICKSFL